MWFADPMDDDFCLGPNSPETPFDGDNDAGVQAFISTNAAPLASLTPAGFVPSTATESDGTHRLSRRTPFASLRRAPAPPLPLVLL